MIQVYCSNGDTAVNEADKLPTSYSSEKRRHPTTPHTKT